MGLACQIIIGQAEKTEEAGAFKELTPGVGDSFTVSNFPFENPTYLDQVWAQVVGGVASSRIRSPRMHDDAQGIRLVHPVNSSPVLPDMADQLLYPGDTLIIEGAATEKEKAIVVALQNYYTNLPGIDARLAQWSEVQPRIQNIAGVQITEVTSAVRGWGVGKALTSSFNTLKSSTDYAILGYTTSVLTTALRVIGPDTGNLGIGGPGILDPRITADWFARQSRLTGRPYVPIIASNNAGATLVSVAATTEVKPNVTLILAELG